MAKCTVTREEPKPTPKPAIKSVTIELTEAEAREFATLLANCSPSTLVEDVRLAIERDVLGVLQFRRPGFSSHQWFPSLPDYVPSFAGYS